MQYPISAILAAAALAASCGIDQDLVVSGADTSAASTASTTENPTSVDALEPAGLVALPELATAGRAGAWDRRFTIPGFLGPDGHAPTVYDFTRDVDGSIVAAGEFRYLGSQRVEPLLRLRNGQWQPARTKWELTPPGSGFSSVAIAPDGKLAVATYDDFGPRSGEIWLDDGHGLRVIGTFDGLIRRLHWYRGQLWAAGWDQIHQGARVILGLAVWNGVAWAAPPGGAPTGFGFELIDDGSDLLVGGDFIAIGGIEAGGVAAWNGSTWRAMSFTNGAAVYALARGPDRQLYAGGALGDLGDGAGGIARWTGSTWANVAGGVVNRFFPGVVTDLTAHAGSLYVAGCFATAGGAVGARGAVASRDIARFDGAWHALDDGTHGVRAPWLESLGCGDEGPNSVWDVSKQSMFSAGGQLLIGGSFAGIAGTISQSIIAYDGAAWRPQGGTTGLGIGGSLDHLGLSGSGQLWGAGELTHVAGVPTTARVVRFTGAGWTAIRDTIPRDAVCLGFAVSRAGDVALGCLIFPPDGDTIGRVYRVQRDRLTQIGGDLPPVQAVTYDARGDLWVGGGGATGFVAHLERGAFVIDDRFDAPVFQLDAAGPRDVIAAGLFTTAGGTAANKIARWNGAAWRPLGDGIPGFVTALARSGATVYVSTFDDGSGALLLGAFDGTTWRELASPGAGLTPQTFFNFNAIRPIAGGVIAVGTAELDDRSGRGALTFRGGKFTAPGGGVHAITLSGLAVGHDEVWVGGLIAEAAAADRTVSSVGVAHWVLGR